MLITHNEIASKIQGELNQTAMILSGLMCPALQGHCEALGHHLENINALARLLAGEGKLQTAADLLKPLEESGDIPVVEAPVEPTITWEKLGTAPAPQPQTDNNTLPPYKSPAKPADVLSPKTRNLLFALASELFNLEGDELVARVRLAATRILGLQVEHVGQLSQNDASTVIQKFEQQKNRRQ